MDNHTKYEVIEKETGKIYEVTGMDFGEETVTAKVLFGDIIFTKIGKTGDLQNETFSIREVGTHIQADGTGTINDLGTPTE